MKLRLIIRMLSLAGCLAFAAAALAQSLDGNWLAGKWRGEAQPTQGRPVQQEIAVSSDGTFTGNTTGGPLGPIQFLDGKWQLAGDTVTFSYRVDYQVRTGERVIRTATWTLKRNGEELEGSGRNDQSVQWTMKFERAK